MGWTWFTPISDFRRDLSLLFNSLDFKDCILLCKLLQDKWIVYSICWIDAGVITNKWALYWKHQQSVMASTQHIVHYYVSDQSHWLRLIWNFFIWINDVTNSTRIVKKVISCLPFASMYFCFWMQHWALDLILYCFSLFPHPGVKHTPWGLGFLHGICMTGWVDSTHIHLTTVSVSCVFLFCEPCLLPHQHSTTLSLFVCVSVCVCILCTVTCLSLCVIVCCIVTSPVLGLTIFYPSLSFPLFCPLWCYDVLGGILKPTVTSSPNQSMTLNGQQPNRLVSHDLDSSLANLVGSKITFSDYDLIICLIESIHINLIIWTNDTCTEQFMRTV